MRLPVSLEEIIWSLRILFMLLNINAINCLKEDMRIMYDGFVAYAFIHLNWLILKLVTFKN